jgi:tuberculosinol/isotuberculosinol synthase
MDFETFQDLPTPEVARLVREAGPRVCVFPINGTRRWFMLEHPAQANTGDMGTYVNVSGQRHIELYELFFDHGIDTLLTPLFGAGLISERGNEYMELAAQGLLWFVQDQGFANFCDAYDVRVRIYGDSRRCFGGTPYAHVLDGFDQLEQRTATHQRYRLFLGVCADDPTEAVVEMGVRFHTEHGRLPDKREVITIYYGEYVEPVNFFVGFDRPSAFDMPLIATGSEDLYFTVSPSPYLDTRVLRAILYDHLYARRVNEGSYAELSSDDWAFMKAFYRANADGVLGLGEKRGEIWYPLRQVKPLDDHC